MAEITEKVKAVRDALAAKDSPDLSEKVDALTAALHAVATKLYANAGDGGAPGSDAPPAGGATAESPPPAEPPQAGGPGRRRLQGRRRLDRAREEPAVGRATAPSRASVRPGRRPGVPDVGPDEPVVGRLFQSVGAPTRGPGDRERRREQLARKADRLEDDRPVEFDIEEQAGLRVLPHAGRRPRRARPPRRARAARGRQSSSRSDSVPRPAGPPSCRPGGQTRRAVPSERARRRPRRLRWPPSPTASSMSETFDGAPPWAGPFRAPMAATAPETRSDWVEMHDPEGERRCVHPVVGEHHAGPVRGPAPMPGPAPPP